MALHYRLGTRDTVNLPKVTWLGSHSARLQVRPTGSRSRLFASQPRQSDPVRLHPTEKLSSCLPPIPSIRVPAPGGLCAVCISLNTSLLAVLREQPLGSQQTAWLLAGNRTREHAAVPPYLLVEDVQGLPDVLNILLSRAGLL